MGVATDLWVHDHYMVSLFLILYLRMVWILQSFVYLLIIFFFVILQRFSHRLHLLFALLLGIVSPRALCAQEARPTQLLAHIVKWLKLWTVDHVEIVSRRWVDILPPYLLERDSLRPAEFRTIFEIILVFWDGNVRRPADRVNILSLDVG